MLAAAFSLGFATPAFASGAGPVDAFDTAIAEAKSLMMADSASALALARDAKRQVKGNSADARKNRLTAQWLEGEALMRLNRADEAGTIIEAALKETARSFPDDKLHADLLRSQASFKAGAGEYGQALDSFLSAHNRYKALGEDRSRAIVLQNIGSLYSDARDYERVLRYYRQANEAYPEDNALALSAHNNTANALKELDRLDEAEAEFRSAFNVAAGMESPLLEARILTNIASTQYLKGDYAAAEDTVRRGLRIAYQGAPEWRPFLYGVLAQIDLARGNLARAQQHISQTFAGENLTQTSPFFRDFHDTAYKIYSARGEYKLAAEHLAAFHRIDGQARDLSATANNALLGARFDAANRELRISKLSAEKEANEARLSSAQNQVFLLTAVIALVIAAFLVALLVLRTVSRSRTAIKTANEKLTYVTQHDGLTGLYSRDHFRTLLEKMAADSIRSSNPAVLMFIDLDRFKQINDIYGHAIGDRLLTKVAQRFRSAAGPQAEIGRLGGDEFGLLLPPGIELGEAVVIASDIIDCVSEFYQIDGYELSVGASIGLTLVSGDTSTSVHMTNADLALYEAKNRGRGMCVTYEQSMRQKLEDRSSLESDLSNALENGQLSICYQPIITGSDRSVMGYEALMRWSHPERGVVPPSVFIPIAEEALLIDPLGAWMLRTACTEAARWPEHIKLTVNVSTLQLTNAAFLNTVMQALASSGLTPNRLILELTESLILEMDDELEQLLKSLKSLGVSFALDDFGRGYSSLNYIEKMHFSMIKIDREFVQAAAAGSRRSQAVVTAIVSLAQSLDIDVTAEGIEQEGQADAMLKLGCSCFQGFHFGHPSPDVEQDSKSALPDVGDNQAAA
ncbi:EAL domain-containing protein [Erythrobacter sp. JK5]|uniref:EAL domain-containing protein n=1 Tax=Erythrobacter sp. JK5 TaxID=2829500 RepID=UPI001BAA0187|nr:EAL domain-containing protein [Erythrobacter sp. JK5]QUL38703.1 EAL domain-containing protein [Erythrobacter sp. JK5]